MSREIPNGFYLLFLGKIKIEKSLSGLIFWEKM